MKLLVLRKIIITLLVCCVSSLTFAQTVFATIKGLIIDEQKEAVIGASVVVKNLSTGFNTGTITNINGEFLIKQLPLGGPYEVEVSYIGYNKQKKSGYTLNQGDVVSVKMQLTTSDIKMDEVVVVANSMKNKSAVVGSSTSISQNELATLPVNGRNFTSLTDLSPLSSGSKLSGQLGTSTSYTIDGMTARGPLCGGTTNRGSYLVSMEAIREFEVVTNSYDVTQGRSGGGTISSVTKSGTNDLHGSVFVYGRADALASKYLANGNKNKNEYSITQLGFSLGGPIIKDRAHFFVALDQQIDSRPLLIGDIRNTEDEKTYGISKNNLDKFIDIARNKYGVSSSDQIGSFTKRRPTTTLFTKVDWQINAQNLLTIRNNYNRDMNNLSVSDNSRINLYEVYGSHLSQDNSFLAQLRSVLSPKITNDLKVQYLHTTDDGRTNKELPSENIPRAIVENIASTIDGKEYKLSSIQLGGQRYEPELFKNDVAQLVNNMYYNTNHINYTFGADLMYTHLKSKQTSEMNGRFYYNGMDNFENNKPYRYAREIAIGDPTINQSVINSALYAQAQINLSKGLSITAGLRGDYSYYINNPKENKLLTDELNLSTTNKVRSLQLQPRFQLTWDVNDKHKDLIKIGGGIMSSNMNNYAMVNNLLFDGNKVYSIDINSNPNEAGYCLGFADFNAYRKDPSKAPGIELFNQLGIAKSSTYNINAKNLKLPTVYKYNISYNKFITDDFRVGFSFYGSNARNNYMYIDRNMVDNPCFTLKNEGGRGVYVPAETITDKGITDWTRGRKSDKISRVLELVSKGEIDSYSFVFDMSYHYFKDGQISMSYTWNDTKDNTSYNGNVANSATLYRMINDDPRDLSYKTYSDGQFRHKLVVYGNTPTYKGFNIGLRYSGIGGTRYSTVVGGNINGDYVNGNDLAYVFDPNDPKTPSNIKQGINDLLNNSEIERSYKDYLKKSFGKIAERNGGVNPFQGTFDVKINKSISLTKAQKIDLSIDLFNVANIINKEWGVFKTLSKQTLYTVKGFDKINNEYVYSVNPNAGKCSYSGTPWQIQLGLKYKF